MVGFAIGSLLWVLVIAIMGMETVTKELTYSDAKWYFDQMVICDPIAVVLFFVYIQFWIEIYDRFTHSSVMMHSFCHNWLFCFIHWFLLQSISVSF